MKKSTLRWLAITLATALGLVASSAAAVTAYEANLAGGNEIPVVPSAGTGQVRIVVSTAGDTIRFVGTFANLTSPTVAAHLHCCVPATSNGPAVVDTPSLPGFPLGVTSGAFDQTFNLLDASTYSAAFVTANGGTAVGARDRLLLGLDARETYFNIHSQNFRGGEIRGQLAKVPEPATWSLLIVGFGLAGAGLRRRNSRAVAAI